MVGNEKTNNFNALSINFKLYPSGVPHLLLNPKEIEVKITPSQYEANKSRTPFPYFTDALVGLAANKLLSLSQSNSISTPNDALCALLWEKLEPLHSIYQRSHERLKPLLKEQSLINKFEKQFEHNFKTIIQEATKENKINIQHLTEINNAIFFLENKLDKPLLFNRDIQFSHSAMNMLHTLYSFLYNLRSLIAMDHNSHIREVSFEGLKLDPITDYLPYANYCVNDALLYFHWQSLSSHKPHPDSNFTESMEQAFRNFTHNGYYLVKSLPKEFFELKKSEQVEDALNRFQMDWVLGSAGGLLFRVREELYAIKEGYEKIFWTDLHEKSIEPHAILESQCCIGPDQLKVLSEAA